MTHAEAEAAAAAVAKAFDALVEEHQLMGILFAAYREIARRLGPVRKEGECWMCGRAERRKR